jgi:ribonuclease HI
LSKAITIASMRLISRRSFLANAFRSCHSHRVNERTAKIEIYTDGAASPNPGPGGYGVIIARDAVRTELSGGFRKTTNNRMELRAVIEGLRALGEYGLAVTVYSDSRYVVDMFRGGYAAKWRAHGWMRNGRDHAENPDLWGQLLDVCSKHDVTFAWVRGHNFHPDNERCDELAVNARQAANLPPDTGYEEVLESRQQQAVFEWMTEK